MIIAPPEQVASFIVSGVQPAPEPRARATVRGGFARVFRAPGVGRKARPGEVAARRWREAVAEAAVQAMSGDPTHAALSVSVAFLLDRPKSHLKKDGLPRKGKPANPFGPGDIDNFVKGTFDALNGIVWHDDAQVCNLSASKVWTVPGVQCGCVFVASLALPDHEQ